jgi:hypothetical protein
MRLLAVALVASLMSMFSVAKAEESESSLLQRIAALKSEFYRALAHTAWDDQIAQVDALINQIESRSNQLLSSPSRGLCFVSYDVGELHSILQEQRDIKNQSMYYRFSENRVLNLRIVTEAEERARRSEDNPDFELLTKVQTWEDTVRTARDAREELIEPHRILIMLHIERLQALVFRMDILEQSASQSCVLPEEGDLSGSEVVNSAVYGESVMSGQ